jgi:subtilisin family serine protease
LSRGRRAGPAALRLVAALASVLAAAALAVPAALSSSAAEERTTAVVSYRSEAALRAALSRHPALVVRRLPDVRAAEVRANRPSEFATGVSKLPGIVSVEAPVRRFSADEPALTAVFSPGVPYEWQYVAARVEDVPEAVLRAASSMTIAVIDTGADLAAPDLAAKEPATYNVFDGGTDVEDLHGHGTFVASIAGGSVTNGEGIAGFGGDAKLLVIQAGREDGSFTDVDEAEAIVHAVNRGAKVINLSIGGTRVSALERKALEYAASHGVLVVAAAGNEFERRNPVEYPAAHLQPVGSKGRGGWGLSVGATTMAGRRASFSNTGTWISMAAPGEDVFGAISSDSDDFDWPREVLPGSSQGLFGFSSGTSFAAPQVAGAAALVWAANPALARDQVAWVLKRSASGAGSWTPSLGFGILDVGRAVSSAAGGVNVVPLARAEASLKLIGPPRRVAKRAPLRIRGVLRSNLPAISPAARRVSLQVLRGGGWHRVARAPTKGDGSVVFRTRLRAGRYMMRIRYVGEPELESATSRTVVVRTRPQHQGPLSR